MRKQQIWLLIIWFILTFLTFGFLFVMTMMRDALDTGGTAALVKWLGVVTAGTLVAMVGTMILQERQPKLKMIPPASPFLFGLTIALCLLYWLIAIATIVFWGLRSDTITLADWLFQQLPWITFLQGVLLALLAFFFNKMRKSAALDEGKVGPAADV